MVLRGTALDRGRVPQGTGGMALEGVWPWKGL